jgi:NAD(P)H dehydrogenase (quinone)
MRVLILFYSTYGHMYAMARAAAEGAEAVQGAEVKLARVPELLSDEVLEQMGAREARSQWEHLPEATHEDLEWADGILFGIPTRFGNMAGQVRMFLDSTGPLWYKGALIGKVGSVMSSSATQHGGQESTILSSQITLLHQGMIIVGLPYSFQGQTTLDEISGGSPYGATTIAGGDGSRQPSENELEAARVQGRRVAEISGKLAD